MNTILLSSFLVLFPTMLAAAAPPKDPQVEKDLRALFDKWDLNHDNFLDRDELAKHFRGPQAVSPKGGAYDEKGNISPLYYQARKKYPDLVFLWSLDTDMDDQISWPEFEKYGQQYGAALKQQLQSQQRLRQQIYARANRNIRSARYGRTNYVRHGRRGYGQQQRHAVPQYVRNVANYQRQVARVQSQRMGQYRYAMERQMNFYRMAAAQQRRWMQQYQSYLRSSMARFYRMPMRHFSVHYRLMWR